MLLDGKGSAVVKGCSFLQRKVSGQVGDCMWDEYEVKRESAGH